MVIFHSHVSLPEGTSKLLELPKVSASWPRHPGDLPPAPPAQCRCPVPARSTVVAVASATGRRSTTTRHPKPCHLAVNLGGIRDDFGCDLEECLYNLYNFIVLYIYIYMCVCGLGMSGTISIMGIVVWFGSWDDFNWTNGCPYWFRDADLFHTRHKRRIEEIAPAVRCGKKL